MHKFLAAAVLCASSAGSTAQTNYSLSFSGGGTHFRSAWECPNTICSEWTEHVSFVGTLDLQVATPLDGIFSGDTLHSFILKSNLVDFTNRFPWAITVEDGAVVSIEGMQTFPFEQRVSFHGMTIDFSQGLLHHYGPTVASASILAVPEPSTWASLSLGIPFILYGIRRSRPGKRPPGGSSRTGSTHAVLG